MSLQQPSVKSLGNPNLSISNTKTYNKIYCHKCGAEITFDKDHVAPSGRKIPLDPHYNNERHDIHCMYANQRDRAPDTNALLLDFLSKVPRKKRVIGAVGRDNN